MIFVHALYFHVVILLSLWKDLGQNPGQSQITAKISMGFTKGRVSPRGLEQGDVKLLIVGENSEWFIFSLAINILCCSEMCSEHTAVFSLFIHDLKLFHSSVWSPLLAGIWEQKPFWFISLRTSVQGFTSNPWTKIFLRTEFLVQCFPKLKERKKNKKKRHLSGTSPVTYFNFSVSKDFVSSIYMPSSLPVTGHRRDSNCTFVKKSESSHWKPK